MKFYFKKIILWCKNGTKREVVFQPNKVNVITGGSGTGKSDILNIIDYCFLASEHKISEDIVNENVAWYGINFFINNKIYTIAREAPNSKKVSDNYYFSSLGEIPIQPSITDTNKDKLKDVLEVEFNINDKIIIPYGAKGIDGGMKKDTKISFRFFMLFNTLSYATIDNDEVFFDKQNNSRYRIALERIFDLSLGIETIENIIARERKNYLEEKIEKDKKKEENFSIKKEIFHNDILSVLKKAKEFGLLESDEDINSSIESLKNLINQELLIQKERKTEKYQKITKEIYLLNKKIDNLRSFEKEYELYKKNLKETEDSLKPILYLNEKENEVIKTSIFNELISSFSNDLTNIKKAIKSKTPINVKVINLINEYENKIKEYEEKLGEIPQEIKNFEDNIEKYIFLGEVKAKLEIFENKEKINNYAQTIDLTKVRNELKKLKIKDNSEQKRLTLNLLEEYIQEDIEFLGDALSTYSKHKASFNIKEKKLELRQPHSNQIVNTGSSSVDMLLHLLLFFGLHKVIMTNKVSYIAPYLIMDQPSKPYYGEDNKDTFANIEETDQYKIGYVFKLLNEFMKNRIEKEGDFQMIVFEHVPPSTWEKLEYIHLVEEFRNGNALILEENKS